jgi:hypothetical protein
MVSNSHISPNIYFETPVLIITQQTLDKNADSTTYQGHRLAFRTPPMTVI